MTRPLLLLTDGRAPNLREAAAAAAAASAGAGAAAATVGRLDFEYTAVLEALLGKEDDMPCLAVVQPSTNRPPCQYQ